MASIATLARHYGNHTPVNEIRHIVHTGPMSGTTAWDLVLGLRQLGFAAEGLEGKVNSLHEVPLPAICHIEKGSYNHFVVVHAISKRYVVVADPAVGLRREKIGLFRDSWSGVLIVARPVDLTKRLRRRSEAVWTLVRERKDLLLSAVGIGIASSILGLATAVYLRFVIDHALRDGNAEALTLLSQVLAGLLLAGIMAMGLRAYFLLIAGMHIDRGAMTAFVDRIICLPLRFFESREVGEIITRLQDGLSIRTIVSETLPRIVIQLVTLIVATSLLFLMGGKLAWIAIVAMLLLGAIAYLAYRPFEHLYRDMYEANAEIRARLVEWISGIATVKSVGAEDTVRGAALQRIDRYVQARLDAGRAGLLVAVATSFVGAGGTLAVLWIGGGAVLSEQMTLGSLVASYALFGIVVGAAHQLSMIPQQLQSQFVSIDRYRGIIEEPSERLGGAVVAEDRSQPIDIHNLRFSYQAHHPLIESLSLLVPHGESIAIVGDNGTGKSTLAKLLAGFYSNYSGDLKVFGRQVSDLDPKSLRQHVALVNRSSVAFAGTVAENLALAETSASESGLAAVAHRLCETTLTSKGRLGEAGVGLSAGERQMLAIARVLQRGPSILILDEATNSLSLEKEVDLVHDLVATAELSTLVLITHRLAATAFVDRVVVLNEGTIAETGSMHQLLQRRGHFWGLWEMTYGNLAALDSRAGSGGFHGSP